MSSSAPFKLTALSIAIATAGFAMTANAASDSEIETLTIYADTYRNTASKSALDPEETPQGITVVDKAQLEQRAAESLSQAVRYTPGVDTELRGGAVTRMDSVNIRGFNNLEHFYDGLPLLYNGWWLQPQVDAAALQQVEVFKGPTSVLYGAMPPGGMVNMISNQPSAEAANSIELDLGSRQLKGLTLNSQGRVANREDLNYSLTAKTKTRDSQADTAEDERHLIAGSLNWQVSEDTLINFNLYHQQDPKAGIFNGLPAKGTVLFNPVGKLSKNSFAGDKNWNDSTRDLTMLGYKINHQFNESWTFLQNTRFMQADSLQKNTYSTGLASDNRTIGRAAYLADESSDGFAIDNQLSGIIESGNVEHNLLIGADFSKLKSNIKYENKATSSIDLFAPDHNQISPDLDLSNSPLSTDFDYTKKQIGFYIQDQIRIDKLVLIAGLRYDDFESTNKGKQYTAPTDTKLSANQLSSRVGFLYNYDNGLAPFASYSQSFEPVSGNDRLGNSFVPATAEQIEVGFKYSPLDSDTAATFSLFRIVKDKNITRDPNGGSYDQIQAGEIQSQGAELSISHAVTDALSIDFNATLMDVEFSKDTDLKGKTPTWTAEKSASLWANYQLPTSVLNNAQLGLGVRYAGSTELNIQNTKSVPSYTVVDLAFSTDLSNISKQLTGASFNLSVNNLFDKEYNACYDENVCWYGAERSIQAKFKYAF